MSTHSFAAFIMTYERTSVLKSTINAIFGQTLTPEKILIVDNSDSLDTKMLIEELGYDNVVYHRVGYNAGPAGAAKIGLQILSAEGYQWIYWGDDDDPPAFNDSFEKLFYVINNKSIEQLGIVGGVGQLFNRLTGTIDRVTTDSIMRSESLEVDSIAGGQTMIVNTEIVKMGILPDENFFFGFEELDFCLKVQQAGFKIMVSSELFTRAREKYNRLNYKRPMYIKKEIIMLRRQYYSMRNLLVILRKERLYIAYVYTISKGMIKSLVGFRYGWKYGSINFSMMFWGIVDSMNGTMNKVY
jgi:GT2 family glycosyltransferase